METMIAQDERINRLLEVFKDWHIENMLRLNACSSQEQDVVETIARRARELGPDGLNDLRRLLVPESKCETVYMEGAARALAELEDGPSLGLVIYQAAKLWDTCIETGRLDEHTFRRFLKAARKMIPDTLKRGPLPEGVTKVLTIFVQGVSDQGPCDEIFETAACTGSQDFRDKLVKIYSDESSNAWHRRRDALFALRHYPEMQATMLEAINHANGSISHKAAEAMVEMLAIIPGCGRSSYFLWKQWAMEQVPPELRLKKLTWWDSLFHREPPVDRRQHLFWNACEAAHREARFKEE